MKKNQWGGARSGAGRPKRSGLYGEATKVLRVPASQVTLIKAWLQNHQVPIQHQTYPLYSTSIAAGLPALTDDHLERYLDLNEHLAPHPGATFLVRVQGDSMIGAGIHEQDLLVIDRSLEVTNGKVVIAVVNGELTVKRLRKKGSQLSLVAENPKYPPLAISEEMAFQVLGVVTKVIHSL